MLLSAMAQDRNLSEIQGSTTSFDPERCDMIFSIIGSNLTKPDKNTTSSHVKVFPMKWTIVVTHTSSAVGCRVLQDGISDFRKSNPSPCHRDTNNTQRQNLVFRWIEPSYQVVSAVLVYHKSASTSERLLNCGIYGENTMIRW